MNHKLSKLSFFRSSMSFHIIVAAFEPQNDVVVEQSEAENILLVSGCLVSSFIVIITPMNVMTPDRII